MTCRRGGSVEVQDTHVHIAMIGTRGVPARYGGFETCIEEVGSRLADRGHRVTVYSRATGEEPQPEHYRGMDVVTLPAVKRRSLETLSHTTASVAHLLMRRRPDAAVVFNAANAPLLPVLRASGVPVATHVDGLEWRRAKWGARGQQYYRQAEAMAVRWSDAIVADAVGIADYYQQRFGVSSELIAYGAPSVTAEPGGVAPLDLSPRGYHLVVARFEPENHVREIVAGYTRSSARLPLVVVGGAPYSDEYTREVQDSGDGRVRFLGGVWDQHLLDQLYANAFAYWHGHSVGGTNPSLLRAIGAGAPTNAFDVTFNREVIDDAGRWWSSPDDVAALAQECEADPTGTARRGERAREHSRRYDWDDVAAKYLTMCEDLAGGRLRRMTRVPRPAAKVEA